MAQSILEALQAAGLVKEHPPAAIDRSNELGDLPHGILILIDRFIYESVDIAQSKIEKDKTLSSYDFHSAILALKECRRRGYENIPYALMERWD